MLRDKNLVPLSHQHQHALALCVRIDRASPIPDKDLDAWQTEIRQQFHPEIKVHFFAEESILFPAAKEFSELRELVDDLSRDHTLLREDFARAEAGSMSAEHLLSFARRLSEHIRKEERQLFEALQKKMDVAQLSALGAQLQDALKDVEQTCTVPNATTRLRAAK